MFFFNHMFHNLITFHLNIEPLSLG